MLAGRTVFAQLMAHVSQSTFQRCVARYRGENKASRFSCWDQSLCMAFAQLTYRESLRDIEACLRAVQPKLYHLGIRARVARSTIADANETRDWRIYADFAHGLIRAARALSGDEPLAVDLADTVYALDATIIDLCLSVFPWARYRRHDAAVKLHTQLDLRGSIPTIVQMTEGKAADVTFLDELPLEAGAIYIMDRGYVDFERLHRFTDEAAFFVTRTKKGIRFRRRTSRPVDFATGLQSDHTVGLVTADARRDYPAPLRRVRYVDPETKKRLGFLTNNFALPAITIAHLYKSRWHVGVSRQGHVVQSAKDRPRPRDSGLVAWEAPWRESKTAEPSDNMLRKEYAQRTRLQRTVNADVASLHAIPVAETVDNARKQQEPTETSPRRRLSPAGYQRRHGVKDDVATGEALGARRRKLVEERLAITVRGKCQLRHQGGGSGRSTADGRAAKRARREGPGPVSMPAVKGRQG